MPAISLSPLEPPSTGTLYGVPDGLCTLPSALKHEQFSKNDTGLAANLLGIGRGDRPLYTIEVKSSATYRPSAFENLEDLAPIMGVDTDHQFVVYGGIESFPTRHGKVLDFDSLEALIS